MYLLVLLCTEFGFFGTGGMGQGSQKQTGNYNGVLHYISSLYDIIIGFIFFTEVAVFLLF